MKVVQTKVLVKSKEQKVGEVNLGLDTSLIEGTVEAVGSEVNQDESGNTKEVLPIGSIVVIKREDSVEVVVNEGKHYVVDYSDIVLVK